MKTAFPITVSMIAGLLAAAGSLSAQQVESVEGRQFPLNQYAPPGMVSQWLRQINPSQPPYMQPVKLFLPSEGRVTFYDQRPDRPVELEAPAQAALLVGRVYRFKIDNLPELPGVEFYPTIELIDRLHPPAEKVDEFPVEFTLSLEEFEWAADGRLITKVIYLEQPQRVPLMQLDEPRKTVTLPPAKNALAEADALGRPMAIVRLGGRTPNADGSDPEFFGPGGPVKLTVRPVEPNADRGAGATGGFSQRLGATGGSPASAIAQPARNRSRSRGFGPPVIRISTQQNLN